MKYFILIFTVLLAPIASNACVSDNQCEAQKICVEQACVMPTALEFTAPNVMGNCYAAPNCFGSVIAFNVTTDFCQQAGGHSIKSGAVCWTF